MKNIVLFDIDSKIPNIALMKISAFYKKLGYKIILSKSIRKIKASSYFASTVFYNMKSINRINALTDI